MSMRQQRLRFGKFAATVAFVFSSLTIAGMASAQTCPYNSTQASCACPTSGGGTTCFGGLLYRASDSSCRADSRPCGSSAQVYDCSTLSCVCPSGTTLCSSSGACVTNRTCPAGSTWNVCTDTCDNPYVLISPSSVQTGFINVTGDLKSSGGDAYLSSGKAIRVDGSGVTTLNVGNWGSGATGLNMGVYGNLGLGTSTPSAKLDVQGNVKIANGGTTSLTIRREAPATDFASLSFDTAGTTQWSVGLRNSSTNDLYFRDNINGLTLLSLMQGSGNLGVGTTTPAQKLDVNGTAKMTGFLMATGAGAGKLLTSDASGNGTWATYSAPVTSVSGSGAGISVSPTTGAVVVSNTGVTSAAAGTGIGVSSGTGAVTFSNTGVTSLAAGSGISLSGSTGSVTISNTVPAGISGSGTTNYVPKFTASTSIGNSLIYDNGSYVGVANAAPAYPLDVTGNLRATGTAGFGGMTPNPSFGVYAAGSYGVYGNGTTYGVYGGSANATSGVYGTSNSGFGVTGYSQSSYGGSFSSLSSTGLAATGATYGGYFSATGSGTGVYVTSPNTGIDTHGYTGINAVGTLYGGYGTGQIGLRGDGSTYGVYAQGSTDGVYTTGGTDGVYTTGSSYGIRSYGGPTGIYSYGSNYGVIGAGGSYGVQGNGTTYGVNGNGPTGVYGSGSSVGVYGNGNSIGVQGVGSTGGYFYCTGCSNPTSASIGTNWYAFSGSGIITNNGNMSINGNISGNAITAYNGLTSWGANIFYDLAAEGNSWGTNQYYQCTSSYCVCPNGMFMVGVYGSNPYWASWGTNTWIYCSRL